MDIIDRLKGALFGFAIGDAMGATTEFMDEDEIKFRYGKVEDIVGGGWLNLKAGEITDDTQMSICVMKVLMKNDFSNFKSDLADEFCDWLNQEPDDVGNQCYKAIKFYEKNGRKGKVPSGLPGTGGRTSDPAGGLRDPYAGRGGHEHGRRGRHGRIPPRRRLRAPGGEKI